MGIATTQKMKTKYMYKIICFILLIIVLWRPLTSVYSLRDSYFSRGYAAQYPQLKSAYDTSQYVKKKNPGVIPDETFESFAGGEFLKGLNPILIVHEHPPMGRYIIGLSILLFDNAKTIILFCMAIGTFGVFLIAKLILKKSIYALIPLAVFVNEPLYMSKLYFSPLLEPIQQVFIVFALYFFMRGILSKKYFGWFAATSVMLGFVIAIRFFALGAALCASMVIFLVLKKNFKKLVVFFASLPLALGVLFLAYTRTIESGYSLLDILKIQKYILVYHKSQLISPLSFWDLILFNRWHTWWADKAITSDTQWILVWPIAAILIVLYIYFIARKKMIPSTAEQIVLFWIIAYILLLSVGNSTTRYFLPLLPFFYILATSFVIKLYKLKHDKKN